MGRNQTADKMEGKHKGPQDMEGYLGRSHRECSTETPFLKVYVLTLQQELQRGEVGGTWGAEGLAAPVELQGGCDSEA